MSYICATGELELTFNLTLLSCSMPNDLSRRIRRAAWRSLAVALLVSVCSCRGKKFADVSNRCNKVYTSAWGHPAARSHAIKLLQDSSTCPSATRVSVRGRAVLIAVNLVAKTSKCYDEKLVSAVEEKCGDLPNWPNSFKSHKWHAHADGTRFYGDYIAAQLALLMSASILVLLLHIVGTLQLKKSP